MRYELPELGLYESFGGSEAAGGQLPINLVEVFLLQESEEYISSKNVPREAFIVGVLLKELLTHIASIVK